MDHVVIFTNTASKSILPLLYFVFVRLNLAFHFTDNNKKKPHQMWLEREKQLLERLNLVPLLFSCAYDSRTLQLCNNTHKKRNSYMFPHTQSAKTDSSHLNVSENSYNIVLTPSVLVKWFIDLRSPRKIDVITCCKITDAISVHNAGNPLLIFDEEINILGWLNF